MLTAEAKLFWLFNPMLPELSFFQFRKWEQELFPSSVWALSTAPSNPFRWFFPWVSSSIYTCADQHSWVLEGSLSLSAALCSLVLWTLSALVSSDSQLCLLNTILSPLTLPRFLLAFWPQSSLSVVNWGSIIRFISFVSRFSRSLLFLSWCPVSSFCIFCLGFCCLFFFLFYSGQRVNHVPIIPSWPKTKIPFALFLTSIFQVGCSLSHQLTFVTSLLSDSSSENQLKDHPFPEANPETFSPPLYVSRRIEPFYSRWIHSEHFMNSHIGIHQNSIAFLLRSFCFLKKRKLLSWSSLISSHFHHCH